MIFIMTFVREKNDFMEIVHFGGGGGGRGGILSNGYFGVILTISFRYFFRKFTPPDPIFGPPPLGAARQQRGPGLEPNRPLYRLDNCTLYISIVRTDIQADIVQLNKL